MKHISRRHFLLGSAATFVSTSALAKNWGTKSSQTIYQVISDPKSIAQKIPYYPPALLGLRGDNDGSQTAAHGVALGGQSYSLSRDFSEEYDLVIVGAGISGLAAAYYFRNAHPNAKVLIIDNHEDFGGHAIRNEFTVDGKKLITYGGSESIDSPEGDYSDVAKQLLRDLGVEYKKFHQYFQQDLYKQKWGLKSGVYFHKPAFAENKLVKHWPTVDGDKKANIRAISQFPLPEKDKKLLIQLFTSPANYLKGKTRRQRKDIAENTSYHDFLKNTVRLPEQALNYLKNISSEYWGHAINAISLQEAAENGYAGTQNLGLVKNDGDSEDEPYIYHFPDGNASVARLLVRWLIPSVAAGNTMEDVVTAQFDYDQLDLPEHAVRIRLNSTVLRIENLANQMVGLAYLRKNEQTLQQIRAKKVIYAGHSALAARIIAGLPEKQQTALQSGSKIPMLYAKIALKNAHAFQKMGVYRFYLPNSPYCLVKLDDPVHIGDYRHAQTPDEPIVLHCVRIATAFEGKNNREMYRNGRRQLSKQNLDALQNELFDILRGMYALVGENFDDALAASSFNRWAHGYAYEQTALWDSDEQTEQTTETMQKAIGNIFMAGTDVAWMPYMNNAIDQAHRAVQEALKSA